MNVLDCKTLYVIEKETLEIHTFDGIYTCKEDIKDIISDALLKQLTTIKGRNEAVGKITKRKNRVLLFIDKEAIFYKLSNKYNYYINICNIYYVLSKGNICEVIFANGNILNVNVTNKVIKKKIKEGQKIINYLSKL